MFSPKILLFVFLILNYSSILSQDKFIQGIQIGGSYGQENVSFISSDVKQLEDFEGGFHYEFQALLEGKLWDNGALLVGIGYNNFTYRHRHKGTVTFMPIGFLTVSGRIEKKSFVVSSGLRVSLYKSPKKSFSIMNTVGFSYINFFDTKLIASLREDPDPTVRRLGTEYYPLKSHNIAIWNSIEGHLFTDRLNSIFLGIMIQGHILRDEYFVPFTKGHEVFWGLTFGYVIRSL